MNNNQHDLATHQHLFWCVGFWFWFPFLFFFFFFSPNHRAWDTKTIHMTIKKKSVLLLFWLSLRDCVFCSVAVFCSFLEPLLFHLKIAFCFFVPSCVCWDVASSEVRDSWSYICLTTDPSSHTLEVKYQQETLPSTRRIQPSNHLPSEFLPGSLQVELSQTGFCVWMNVLSLSAITWWIRQNH